MSTFNVQVQSELAALNLEADMVGRAVKKSTSERQQKLVDLDVRKLEVQHLRESLNSRADEAVSYTHLRAHETKANLVCRLLLEKKK